MNKRTIAVLLVSSLVAAGCGGDDSPPVPPSLKVSSASGARYELNGTTWVSCHANEPVATQSRQTVDVYSAGTLQHTEDVYTAATNCTGATDPAAHFSSGTANVSIAPDRTVGWNAVTPPPGLAENVAASPVTYSGPQGAFLRTLAFVDDTVTPQRLYSGNDGNGAVLDIDGYPVELEPLAAVKQ
jgi:hypothetical protein